MEELRRGACSRCSCGRAPGLRAGLCGREGEGGIVSDDVDRLEGRGSVVTQQNRELANILLNLADPYVA